MLSAFRPHKAYLSLEQKCIQAPEEIFWGVKRGRCVRLTSRSSLSRLSKQCGVLNTSECCGPPQPVTGIALLLLLYTIWYIIYYSVYSRQTMLRVYWVSCSGYTGITLYPEGKVAAVSTWSYTSTLLYTFKVWCAVNLKDRYAPAFNTFRQIWTL
jgi:hypothetical protein